MTSQVSSNTYAARNPHSLGLTNGKKFFVRALQNFAGKQDNGYLSMLRHNTAKRFWYLMQCRHGYLAAILRNAIVSFATTSHTQRVKRKRLQKLFHRLNTNGFSQTPFSQKFLARENGAQPRKMKFPTHKQARLQWGLVAGRVVLVRVGGSSTIRMQAAKMRIHQRSTQRFGTGLTLIFLHALNVMRMSLWHFTGTSQTTSQGSVLSKVDGKNLFSARAEIGKTIQWGAKLISPRYRRANILSKNLTLLKKKSPLRFLQDCTKANRARVMGVYTNATIFTAKVSVIFSQRFRVMLRGVCGTGIGLQVKANHQTEPQGLCSHATRKGFSSLSPLLLVVGILMNATVLFYKQRNVTAKSLTPMGTRPNLNRASALKCKSVKAGKKQTLRYSKCFQDLRLTLTSPFRINLPATIHSTRSTWAVMFDGSSHADFGKTSYRLKIFSMNYVRSILTKWERTRDMMTLSMQSVADTITFQEPFGALPQVTN